jgi:hypothetical protein
VTGFSDNLFLTNFVEFETDFGVNNDENFKVRYSQYWISVGKIGNGNGKTEMYIF